MNKLARAYDNQDWRDIRYGVSIFEGHYGNYPFDTVSAHPTNMLNALNAMCRRHYMNSFAESARSVHENDLELLKKLGLLGCSHDRMLDGLLLYPHQGYCPTIYMVAQDKIKTYEYEDWYGDYPSTEIGYILKYVWCEILQVREHSVGGMFSTNSGYVRPIVTLKPDVYPTGGSGTASDPWQLGI